MTQAITTDQHPVPGRPAAPGRAPVPGAANAVAASTSVQSVLTQDTVAQAGISADWLRGTIAPYANPFLGGAEEMLVIDAVGNLTCVRKSAAAPEWSQTVVHSGEPFREVVVAVHPDGTPWAFAATPDGKMRTFRLVHLVSSSWRRVSGTWEQYGWVTLQIQYLRDRPATAWVFGWDAVNHELNALSPSYGDAPGSRWVDTRMVKPGPGIRPFDLTDGRWACGFQSPGIDGQNGKPDLWLYVAGDDGVRLYKYFQGMWTDSLQLSHLAGSSIDGVWSGMDDTVGVVFHDPAGLWMHTGVLGTQPIRIGPNDHLMPGTPPIVWQDDRNLMHVFAGHRDALTVLHQTGWRYDTEQGVNVPVFLSAQDSHGNPRAVTLPLFTGVGSLALDPYPDNVATQVVLRPEALETEQYVLLTQDTTTSWWSEDVVAVSSGTRRLVNRYVTDVTVRDGFGAPMAGCPVTVSAETRVDVTIGDTTVTLSPGASVPATTDDQGRVTIRQPATGLHCPTIHVNVKGLRDGAAFDAAAETKAFLAGDRTLPNHRAGFTAEVLFDAKVGDEWLVPGWHGPAPSRALPTPDDVVTWCRELLAPTPDAGGGLLLQLTDPDQPCLVRLETLDEVASSAQRLRADASYRGVLDPSYLSDVWQGITEGVLVVAKTLLDFAQQTATVYVQALTDGSLLEVVLSYADGTATGRLVESIFEWLGAGASRLVAWLAWAFDFNDVWSTNVALQAGLRDLPTDYVKVAEYFLGDLVPSWFESLLTQVTEAIAELKASLAGSTVSGWEGVVSVDADQRAVAAPVADAVSGVTDPHLDWLPQQLRAWTAPNGGLPMPSTPDQTAGQTTRGLDDLWDEVWQVFDGSQAGQEFGAALTSVMELFTNLFDFDDPATLVGKEITSILELVEHLASALLHLCDAMAATALALVKSLAESFTNLLDTPIESEYVQDLYTWIQTQAGQTETVPATVGGLSCLLVSFPLTALYKSTVGSAPFPDGTFPPLGPIIDDDSDDDSDGAEVPQWSLQLIPAFVQWGALWSNAIVNSVAGYAPNPMLLPMAGQRGLHAITDDPRLRGIRWDGSTTSKIAYAQASLRVFVAVVEVYLGVKRNTGLNYIDAKQGTWLLSFIGWAQEVLAFAAYRSSAHLGIDLLDLHEGIAKNLPDATAFTRQWILVPPPHYLGLAHSVKTNADNLAVMYAGGARMVGPGVELYDELGIANTEIPIGRAGVPYSVRLEPTGGWAPYRFAEVDPWPIWIQLTEGGLLHGTPPSPGQMQITVTLTDGYRPPAQLTVQLPLVVTDTQSSAEE